MRTACNKDDLTKGFPQVFQFFDWEIVLLPDRRRS
jgi:hypothetical protein